MKKNQNVCLVTIVAMDLPTGCLMLGSASVSVSSIYKLDIIYFFFPFLLS